MQTGTDVSMLGCWDHLPNQKRSGIMKEIMKQTPLLKKHMQTASSDQLKRLCSSRSLGHVSIKLRRVTICDVSHMGDMIRERSWRCTKLSPTIQQMSIGRLCIVCVMKGSHSDDLICFRLAQDEFLWVKWQVNEDFQWILQHSQGMEVQVTNISCETALIALQAPILGNLQKMKADLSTLGYYRLTKPPLYRWNGSALYYQQNRI